MKKILILLFTLPFFAKAQVPTLNPDTTYTDKGHKTGVLLVTDAAYFTKLANADSTLFAQFDLYGKLIFRKVIIIDTAAMLLAYRNAINLKVNISDTSAMLAAYRASINSKVNISDTANMLLNYLKTATANAIYATISGLALKVNISDTSTMLAAYRAGINTNAVAILTKLNITDTANIRLRAIAGTNTTITGTYPNLTFNSTGSSTPTFQQVLTAGSILTTNNSITPGSNTLFVSGGTRPFVTASTGGASLETLSTEPFLGTAIYSRSAVNIANNNIQTNTLALESILNSGVAASVIGFGTGIVFRGQTVASTTRDMGYYGIRYSNAADSIRSAYEELSLVNNTVSQIVRQTLSTGQLKLNKYGVNTFAAAPAYILGVTATGNVIETPIPINAVYQQTAVPFANASGILISDSTKLSFGGEYLSIATTSAAGTSGILLNQGRAEVNGQFSGMYFNVGSGKAAGGVYDASKGYIFQNRGNTIFQISTSAISAGVNTAAFTANVTATGTITSAQPIKAGGYTVATLPTAGIVGRVAYVTDATAPTYLGALTGGGTVKCPVFDNGVSWVSH